MGGLLQRVVGDTDDHDCACSVRFEDERLLVDSDDCSGRGVLATEPDCRATVVRALEDRPVDAVVTRGSGLERAYEDDAAALLVAAGHFADAVAFHDDRVAARARRDPLGAAREATGRAGPVARLAGETGLAEARERARDYEDALTPYVGLSLSSARVAIRPPGAAELLDRRELETGAVVRTYDQAGRERPVYHLDPLGGDLDPPAAATLAAAYDRLAEGELAGERAPGRAVRAVADGDADVETLARVLRKHTRGYGVLTDLFADDRVSDVFATAPVTENRLRVRVDGDVMRTNVRITERGVAALASRFRRTSGRPFSRTNPSLDATVTVADRQVRVAGVTAPVSEGTAFAFRAHERDVWTLPALVGNGTLPPDAAALLSLAVERDAALLVAGTRGAGKTTLLGALLWELPATTRTVVIEDTPELPVARLQEAGRDVQLLRVSNGDGPGFGAATALRTALRLGEGALVVGEVRGEEAAVLYEAMRVGASGSAVLGTIHGDGGQAVRERVVTDLGVPPSSFGATDLLVTVEPYQSDGERGRRVAAVEEVVTTGDGVAFESLYELEDGRLVDTGRIDRGNSQLLQTLGRGTEEYATLREELRERSEWIRARCNRGETGPAEVCTAHARRRER